MAMYYADKDNNNVQSKKQPNAGQKNNWSVPLRTSQQCVTPPFSGSMVFDTMSIARLVTIDPNVAEDLTAFLPKSSRN